MESSESTLIADCERTAREMLARSPEDGTPRRDEAILSALVARFNVTPGAGQRAALEQLLWRVLRRLDAEKIAAVSEREPGDLDERIDDWLETAGQVGGPEREQDPTRRTGRRPLRAESDVARNVLSTSAWPEPTPREATSRIDAPPRMRPTRLRPVKS